jgi:hypothetical protein
MTPKKGITVSQAEMCTLVIMSRLGLLASLKLVGQIQISMSPDSETIVSVIQKDDHAMLPYWQARTSEVTNRKEDLAKEGCEVEEVSHV